MLTLSCFTVGWFVTTAIIKRPIISAIISGICVAIWSAIL